MLTQSRFEAHLSESGLWPDEGQVLVAYSGGADSACLVHLLAQGNRKIIAAYLHHGMREEANKEQELAAAFCASLNVQFVSGRADVPALAREQKVGLEEAGRIARYTFLRQAANQLGCVRIATAHTLTDHVETILMHVVRGSGRRGLGGIAAQSGDLIRPFLPFSRKETRSYCDTEGLWYYDDPANTDRRFARSRLRSEVFPVLRELNPSVNEAVARLSAVMREEDIFLDGAAAGSLEHLEVRLNGDLGFLTRHLEIGIDLPHFRHLPPALVRRGVRLCFETLGGELDFGQTAVIVDGLLGHSSGSVTSEGGEIVAEWTPTDFVVRKLEDPEPFELTLPIPGSCGDAALGWELNISEEPNNGQISERAGLTVWVEGDALGSAPSVRSVIAGDRLRPLGFEGTRKISDLMGEAGLTAALKKRIPILADENGPIWLPGICLDNRFGVKATTKRVLKLALSPASGH